MRVLVNEHCEEHADALNERCPICLIADLNRENAFAEKMADAVDRLARSIAEQATVVPRGLKFPDHTVPTDHPFYAVAMFDDRTFEVGGSDPQLARATLKQELVAAARNPDG